MRNGASSLSSFERLSLGTQVARGQLSVSGASRKYDVSRKFARDQRDMVVRIVEEEDRRGGQSSAVVVTDDEFFGRFVVAAALICNCPFRGIRELCETMFGYAPSLGAIHNICRKAIERAKECNSAEKLDGIRHAAIDEIFQNSTPVFTGVDLASQYIFLLSEEEARSGEAWQDALELCKKKGLAPKSVIGDGGLGLRKGMGGCFPDVPCDSDVFHALKNITQELGYLEKKALGAMGKVEELKKSQEKRKGLKKNGLNRQLGEARKRERGLLHCHSSLEAIYGLLREDVLAFNEMPFADRRELFDWLMREIEEVEGYCGRLPSLRKKLERQTDTLLAVFGRLDEAVVKLAGEYKMDVADARMMVNRFNGHHEELRVEMALASIIESHGLESTQSFLEDLYKLTSEAFRASSAVENKNSILRTYFQQRREIGYDYLELLKFYLNHRITDRSRVKKREGKSPYEMLTGTKHAHWLDMLGFTLKAA